MRSRCLGVPLDTDTFLHWGMWRHYMHLLNTCYIYPPFGTSCSDVFSTVFPCNNIFHEFSRFPIHHVPVILHHGSSFHPPNLPQGLLWCFMGISRSSTTSVFNFHVRWNEWTTNRRVWIYIWVGFLFFSYRASPKVGGEWMGKNLESPWVSPKLEVRAVGTAHRSVSAADSAGWFFDHCPAFRFMANVTFPNHKVHLRTSLVWLAWW